MSPHFTASCISTGATAVAIVGFGALFSSTPTSPEVRLTSTASTAPLAPAADLWPWWLTDTLVGPAGAAPAATPVAPQQFRPLVGPGGWLVGDGLDALDLDPACTADCRGGDGGLLWGDGGDGALGGDGGDAGSLFGNGGDGGDGELVLLSGGGIAEAALDGGNGGNGGLFGDGGDGGNGRDASYNAGGDLINRAGDGGDGGDAGLIGTGGD
ncbi:hypothetical protein AAV95_02720, partial [Mycolicibacterium elephantis]